MLVRCALHPTSYAEGTTLKGHGLWLCSVELKFAHPFTGVDMMIRHALPPKFNAHCEREQRRWEEKEHRLLVAHPKRKADLRNMLADMLTHAGGNERLDAAVDADAATATAVDGAGAAEEIANCSGGSGSGSGGGRVDGCGKGWKTSCSKMVNLLDWSSAETAAADPDEDPFSHSSVRPGHFVVSTYILSPNCSSVLVVPTRVNPCGAELITVPGDEGGAAVQETSSNAKGDSSIVETSASTSSIAAASAPPTGASNCSQQSSPPPPALFIPTVHVNPPDSKVFSAAIRAARELVEVEVDIADATQSMYGATDGSDGSNTAPFHLDVEQAPGGARCLHFGLHYAVMARSTTLQARPPPREPAAVRRKKKSKRRKVENTEDSSSAADAAIDGAIDRKAEITTKWQPLAKVTLEAGFSYAVVKAVRALESAISSHSP